MERSKVTDYAALGCLSSRLIESIVLRARPFGAKMYDRFILNHQFIHKSRQNSEKNKTTPIITTKRTNKQINEEKMIIKVIY